MRGAGLDVAMLDERGLRGRDDAAVLRSAHAEARIIVTHDSDFGTLAMSAGLPVTGILYLRPGHIDVRFTIASLEAVLAGELAVTVPFIVVASRVGDAVNIRARFLA